MDNKITRTRLSDFLSYEWILMVIIAIASILVWEIGYTMGSVKLTAGQDFKVYYDSTIISEDSRSLYAEIFKRKTFSYGVQKFSDEKLSVGNYVLADRLSIQDGDIIFTDILGLGEVDESTNQPKTVRAKSMIDTYKYYIGSIDQMIYDAKIYLTKNYFKKGVYEKYVEEQVEGKAEIEKGIIPKLETMLENGADNDEKILNSIDDGKVEQMFYRINQNDNRFREQSVIEKGIKAEKTRIVKLCENVLFYESFIELEENRNALFEYTRYEQVGNQSLMDYEKTKNQNRFGKDSEVFGIKLSNLKNGGALANVMRLVNPKEPDKVADGIVVMAFDFISYQPNYQFESLSFICSTIQIYNTQDNN